jgi:hypothetical protein
MKIILPRITKLLICSAIFSASTAWADSVSINFSTNGFITNKSGEHSSAENSKIVFSNLRFGGACGTIVSNYQKGLTGNNTLPNGTRCTISGVLKRSNGKPISNTRIQVRNHLGTVRATKYTNSVGKFSLSYSTLDNNPPLYEIIGPTVNSTGSRVGCTIYSYDHSV